MKIVRIWEGLGNQMFQYAFAKSLDQRHPGEVFLDVNSSYREYLRKNESSVLRPYMLGEFNISLPKIDVEQLKEWRFIRQSNIKEKIIYKKSLKHKYEYQFVSDTYDVTEFNPSFYYTYDNVYYMGWYQNEGYFRKIGDLIRKDLTLKKDLPIPDLLSGSSNTVSIHVRRGDFVNGGWCVSEDYYDNAIKIIKQKVWDPVFIVFTDDVEWVKSKMFKDDECLFVHDFGKYSASEELILMSKCKHNIIANSTFSWWGAWLNDNDEKVVISPKTWTPRQKNPNCNDWVCI